MSLELSAKYWEIRKNYYRYLTTEKMFYTLALANLVEWEIAYGDNVPSFAWMKVIPKPAVTIHEKLINAIYKDLRAVDGTDYKVSQLGFTVITHELRHFFQLCDNINELYSLKPLLEMLDGKLKAATKPESKEHWGKVIEEFQDPKSPRFKKYMARINNIALDTALHEDVFKLFPHGETLVNKFVMEFLNIDSLYNKEGKRVAGVISTNSFDELFPDKSGKVKLQKDAHFVYYGNELIRREAEKAEKEQDPDDTTSSGEKIGKMIEEALKNKEDIQELSEEEQAKFNSQLDHLKARAEELESKFRESALGRGHSSSDNPILGDSNKKLNDSLKKALEKIKFVIRRIHEQHDIYENSYSKINKKIRALPGSKAIDYNKPTIQIVMIFDTSGSVFNDQIFSKMCGVAKVFYKKNQLQALYCCDTDLHRIDLKQFYHGSIKGLGGGGTALNNTHVEEIVKDLKLKSKDKIDIIYVTDLEVDLTEIKTNKQVNLHLVDIINEKLSK